jgi:small-conductance mechanosensitive channel
MTLRTAPWTQVIDPTNLGGTIDTQSLTIWDFIWAVVIIAGSFLLAAIVRRLMARFLKRFEGVPETYLQLIARATGWTVVVVGVIYALGVLGVDLGPAVIALLLAVGIAFFAGRGLLENFGAGLILQGTSMFEVGDQIETGDGSGTVHEITGRTVVLRTPDGEEINVPNATVVNESLTNLTKLGQRRSTIPVGVAYGTDYEIARRVIRESARSSELALADPEPEALLSEFGDNAVVIELRFWHDPTILGEKQAIDQVARRVALDLAVAGIKIAFPQRTLWWGDGHSPGLSTGDDG